MDDERTQWIIGIDPGLDGATVAIPVDGKEVRRVTHASIDRIDGYVSPIDYDEATEALFRLNPLGVIMEFPMILRGQEGSARIGINWGIVWSSWQRRRLQPMMIHPAVWKRVLVPAALSKEHDKQAACLICADMGYDIAPRTPRSRKPHDGTADAVLIAVYGGRIKGWTL